MVSDPTAEDHSSVVCCERNGNVVQTVVEDLLEMVVTTSSHATDAKDDTQCLTPPAPNLDKLDKLG